MISIIKNRYYLCLAKNIEYMKIIKFVILGLFSCVQVYAQNGKNQFAIQGGYEVFPHLSRVSGGNIGIEFKHYLNNRIYFLSNFHAGINDGSLDISYKNNNVLTDIELKNTQRDYMLGMGIGIDVFQKENHKVYVQSTVGLGSSTVRYDDFDLSSKIINTLENNYIRYALSVSAGYDYRVTEYLAIGINYTGYQIGDNFDFKHTCNLKLSILF